MCKKQKQKVKSSGPRTTSLSKYIETGFWEHGFAFWKKKKKKPARWRTTSPLMSSSTTTWPYFAKKNSTDPFLQILNQSDPFLQKSRGSTYNSTNNNKQTNERLLIHVNNLTWICLTHINIKYTIFTLINICKSSTILNPNHINMSLVES